jgi:hypothetical protein
MSAICDFGQPFQIVNIICSRMADKNRESAAVAVDFAPKCHHGPWLLGEHHHFRPLASIEWCLTF